MKITRIRINGVENPLGFDLNGNLRIRWNVEDTSGKKNKKSLVEISSGEEFTEVLAQKESAQWDCHSLSFDTKKLALLPRTRYFVRISVTDEQENRGQACAYFETGKGEEPWRASWIGTREEDTFHPQLRKAFSVGKEIRRARIYLCGLGLYEASLNGKALGEEVLAPFVNDYTQALQVQTYDITEQLQRGENQLQVMLGNGWYKGRFGFNPTFYYGEEFALIAEIHLEYGDGSTEVVGTDDTWEYCGSEIEQSGIYDGEVYNRLLWEGKANTWKPVRLLDLDKQKLTDRHSIPVKCQEKIPVKEVIHTPAGETVLDMGQNFAGWLTFHSELPKGTRVHLEFGEILQNGNFFNENYRTALGGFTYVSCGEEEWVRPHFTFFGFRYVRVTGWVGEVKAEDFLGYAIYSDMERTGTIRTDNEKLNRLYENCIWGQKSNFLDMPTDCPQRDERLGWTADAQVFAPTATYNMDTEAFYQKFLWDIRPSQLRHGGGVIGAFPDPSASWIPVCAVWGDIATFLPYTLWEFYGNGADLEGLYPMMRDWVEYLAAQMKAQHHAEAALWDFGFQFGDWLALDGEGENAMESGTPNDYLATMYYFRSVQMVREAAAALGRQQDVNRYQELEEALRELLLYEFFTPAGHVSIRTQTAYVLALRFGVYREKQVVVEDFLTLLKKQKYHIKGGFVGAPVLCQTLAEAGHPEAAYEILFQEGYPSWLYAVNMGATTIWERWNSVLPDGTINGDGMNSLNHYSYGSVIEFLYGYGAGIRPIGKGYEKVRIRPMPNGRMRQMECSYRSPAGLYRSNWYLLEDGQLRLELEIPFGCQATVLLPESGREPFVLESGHYVYTYMPKRDFRLIYNEETGLDVIFANEKVKQVLFERFPQAARLDNPVDSRKCLGDILGMGFSEGEQKAAREAVEAVKAIRLW